MTTLPRQARDGLMRAWLDILRERHPEVTWVPADTEQSVDGLLLGEETIAEDETFTQSGERESLLSTP